jgi:hypothetical protein
MKTKYKCIGCEMHCWYIIDTLKKSIIEGCIFNYKCRKKARKFEAIKSKIVHCRKCGKKIKDLFGTKIEPLGATCHPCQVKDGAYK